jgi:HD-GYP domain-containing protein (c-di-GMP phosphodiesterase class II)
MSRPRRVPEPRVGARSTEAAKAARLETDEAQTREDGDLLFKTLSERKNVPATHAVRVGRLARRVAKRLGLSRDDQGQIQLAAELHDIGKAAIPDSILGKPGHLTTQEWRSMKRHTLVGERILLSDPSLLQTAALVRSSHERVDGTGYPDGLSGNDIPLGARVIAVCDAFDAMVSDRSYRQGMLKAEALTELRDHAGTQFDAEVVETLRELVR